MLRSMIPDALQTYIQEKLGEAVTGSRSVSGGSINRAAKLELSIQGSCFLKWNASQDPDMFAKEVQGLQLLADAQTALVIPEIILQGTLDNGMGFLLQEYIEEGAPGSGSAKDFGFELSRLHRTHASQYGLDHNNYIGYLPQRNKQHTEWTSFFIEERVEPQLKMAVNDDKLSPAASKAFSHMYKRLPDLFPEEPPSLLHGDLWGGNYFYTSSGKAAIFDPAVYFGHREMELAFTRLFGGFSAEFYQAYQEAYPLEPGFDSRMDIYNLYPLLVHTNIFGGSYARQVEGIVACFR